MEQNNHHRGNMLISITVMLFLLGLLIITISSFQFSGTSQYFEYNDVTQMIFAITETRARALSTGISTALSYRRDSKEALPHFYRCMDGNGNGISGEDIEKEIDPCVKIDIKHRSGLKLKGLPPGFRLPGDDRPLSDNKPIRFGPHDMLICSGWGRCTSGSIIWTGAKHEEYIAVIFDGTRGSVKVWKGDGYKRWTRMDDKIYRR